MMLQIGSLSLSNPVVVCPIAGYTDGAYRTILREFSDSLMFAEMISVSGLSRHSEGSLRRSFKSHNHHPLGVQLFGSKPELFYDAAKFAEDEGFDLVDVNLGCPKIPGEEMGGSKLLQFPDLVKQIFMNMRKAVKIPVTAKIRAGFNEDQINGPEIAKIAQEEGMDGLTIHGRTCLQKFSGKCNWDWIRQTVASVQIPVIANGDIDSPQKAAQILEYTGASGVMIGRAGLGKPWLIANIARHLSGLPPLPEPSVEKIRELVLLQMEFARIHLGEAYLRQFMKKMVSVYFKDIPRSKEFRKLINEAKGYEEIRQITSSFPFEKKMENTLSSEF